MSPTVAYLYLHTLLLLFLANRYRRVRRLWSRAVVVVVVAAAQCDDDCVRGVLGAKPGP